MIMSKYNYFNNSTSHIKFSLSKTEKSAIVIVSIYFYKITSSS